MKRVKIEIDGMTCPNCERHVEKELIRLGAKKIKVSHVEKSAIFSIGENVTGEVLKKAVDKVGYRSGKVYFKAEEKKGLFGKLLG